MSTKTQDRMVKDMWWEGNDLNIIYDDGEHTRYINAYVSEVKDHIEDLSSNIKCEKVKFVVTGVE